jgi:hypothetical protein
MSEEGIQEMMAELDREAQELAGKRVEGEERIAGEGQPTKMGKRRWARIDFPR